jgi:hypothetical protein
MRFIEFSSSNLRAAEKISSQSTAEAGSFPNLHRSTEPGLIMNTRCHPERSACLTRFFCGSGGAQSKDPYTCKKSQCGRPAQQQI